ncbi:hypothetical protein G4G27_08825 [Sphingomonas sp. So64.6b]|uniref:hypothetical protein n=1 Tax=Sphingomonas sp. So64.6b TaxID=2997354 RepID=UPI00160277EB|nr:hypothetical protein [Sphingomonas sp. So64.6b]QNA84079.1 hypothetical protein G4G27_08825 [Sphingomonas sp. So64.6b]
MTARSYLIGAVMVVSSITIAHGESRAAPPALTMTCHELLRGVPSKDATIYEVIGTDMFATGAAGRKKISTVGSQLYLGTVRDARGPIDSYAIHSRKGMMVTRSVYEQRPGQKKRLFFTDRYDFARHRVIGSDGKDSCHANGR